MGDSVRAEIEKRLESVGAIFDDDFEKWLAAVGHCIPTGSAQPSPPQVTDPNAVPGFAAGVPPTPSQNPVPQNPSTVASAAPAPQRTFDQARLEAEKTLVAAGQLVDTWINPANRKIAKGQQDKHVKALTTATTAGNLPDMEAVLVAATSWRDILSNGGEQSVIDGKTSAENWRKEAEYWVDLATSNNGGQTVGGAKYRQGTQVQASFDSQPDIDTLAAQIEGSIVAFLDARADAAQSEFTRRLKTALDYQEWADGRATPNPVATKTSEMQAEKDRGDRNLNREQAFTTYANAIQDADKFLDDVRTSMMPEYERAEDLIQRLGYRLQHPPSNVDDQQIKDLNKDFKSITSRLPATLQGAKSVSDVITGLTSLHGDLGILRGKVDEVCAEALDLTDAKKQIDATVSQVRLALDEAAKSVILPDETKLVTNLNTQLGKLQLDRNALDGEPDQKKARMLAMSMARDSLSLLEHAKKALFSSSAANPDDVVASFGGRTTTPQDRATCKAALSARFKLDIDIPEGLETDLLPRLYEMFAKVPDNHVGHDKLPKLAFNGMANAGQYDKLNARMLMGTFDGKQPDGYEVDGKDVQVDSFSVTALHEIGHAVDNKYGIMTPSNFTAEDFGGWNVVKVDDFARMIADNTMQEIRQCAPVASRLENDIREAIANRLAGGRPPRPDGITQDQWDKLYPVLNGLAHHRTDAKPWNQPDKKTLAFGGRVYLESYAGQWHSFSLGAYGKTRVSNYQWRAPGEWFAEIYAISWLQKKPVLSNLPDMVAGYLPKKG